jgi:GT2 family glycosyltransferase
MAESFRISVIIPTRDRSDDLAELLETLYHQSYNPCEIIIIDDSEINSTSELINHVRPKFRSKACSILYVEGNSDGLANARNIGVKISKGEIILFLDDDTLLRPNVLEELVKFLKCNPTAVGVSPAVTSSDEKTTFRGVGGKMENIINQAFHLDSCTEANVLKVTRSGHTVFPSKLTKTISAQRLFGCCQCWRREIFNHMLFDENLKKWSFLEDLDFSYRAYKLNRPLFVIPDAVVKHKVSRVGRMPTMIAAYMSTIYWYYVFLKDFFEGSLANLIMFLWSLLGKVVLDVIGLIFGGNKRKATYALIWLLRSYIIAFSNLRNMFSGDLYFFNKNV